MTLEELTTLVQAKSIHGVGNVTLARYCRKYSSPETVLEKLQTDYKKRPRLSFGQARGEVEAALDRGYKIVTFFDQGYPPLLKQIHDPPVYLYVNGVIEERDSLALSVVGTRNYTAYGKEVTKKLVTALSRAGFTIISGMARGIDSISHRAVLDAGGRTIAVLGSGVDVIYPAENQELYEEIVLRGAVVSELPLGTEPSAFNFPARDRLIAGFSRGVLIVEAGLKSGTMITVNAALEQNREVFAVPGSIFSSASVGTNKLLKEGAFPVADVMDILTVLGIDLLTRDSMREIRLETTEEQIIYEILAGGPLMIDEIIRKSNLAPATVGAILAMMEIKGLVKNMGNQQYRKLTA